MSLINQMLRDLDARRGPASNMETAALQGMGLAGTHSVSQFNLFQRTGWVAGLILVGILIQLGYQAWSDQRVKPVTDTLPVAVLPTDEQETSLVRAPVSAEPAPAPTAETTLADDANSAPEAVVPAPGTTPGITIPVAPAKIEVTPPPVIRKTLTPLQKAQRRFNRAQGLLKNGNHRVAAKELRAVLDLDPEWAEARIQLATLRLRQGRTDKAHRLLQAGYRIDPRNTAIAIAYARLLTDQGEYALALETLDDTLQRGTANPDSLALAAGLHYRLGQYSISARRYREALTLQPGQGVWWMGLGVSLEHENSPAEALSAYGQAKKTSLDPALRQFVTGRMTALSGHRE